MRKCLSLFLAFCLLSPPLEAEAPPAPPPAEDAAFNDLADAGLRALYNLDYPEAYRRFNDLAEKYPGSPLGPYAVTTALWWELTNEYDEKNPSLEKKFLEAADRAADVSRRMLKADPQRADARLCLGGSLGLKSRWEAIQGHWLRAYRNGKAAFKEQEKAVELDPTLYDAYLGVGIFHYYAAVLPSVVKVLAKLLIGGGEKEQGLKEIHLSMEKGRFSRTAAKLFLVGIYLNRENEPQKALDLLAEGRREFPQSPFFHFVELLALENAGRWEPMRQGALDFIARVERGDPYYSRKLLHRGHFALANSRFGAGELREALALYDKLLSDVVFEDRWISLSYLYRGKTHDLLGEREKAQADYRAVLARRDVWSLHDKAKFYLDDPYEKGREKKEPK